MKADLAIYTHVLGVAGQYECGALMLNHKMDFNCCANRDGFRKSYTMHIARWSTDYIMLQTATAFLHFESSELWLHIQLLH